MSLLSSSNHSPAATRIAWLLAAAKPVFSALRSRRTAGKSAASMSALPSLDALSTTMTSWSTAPGALERCEALAKEFARVPVDHDDRERRAGAAHLHRPRNAARAPAPSSQRCAQVSKL